MYLIHCYRQCGYVAGDGPPSPSELYSPQPVSEVDTLSVSGSPGSQALSPATQVLHICTNLLMVVIALFSNLFISWLLNVPATCLHISWKDLLRQLYSLSHPDKSCRSNLLSHQSQYTDSGPTSLSTDLILRCLAG